MMMIRVFVLSVSVFAMGVLFSPRSANAGEPDWNKIEAKSIDLFYPGQSAWEWLSSEHDGKKAILRGDDKCIECHEGEEETRGKSFVTGKKLEDDPPPAGTPSMITMNLKTAYDNDYLYMWMQWPGPGKADKGKINAVNIMVDDVAKKKEGLRARVKYFEAYGCWITCHRDAKSMPYTPSADKLAANPYYKTRGLTEVTKYIADSRESMDSSGGWANVKPEDKLNKDIAEGEFIDLWRFVADENNPKGKVVDGNILASRNEDKGQTELAGNGDYKDGKWTVVLKRKLKAGDPKEDKIITPGKQYAVAISIHTNSISRRHYASFARILGFDDDAEANIRAVKAK
ncbi:MAG: hypothetical protein HY880_01085 [Deltaproteobacteria bacterium]|nr:hypothetical protein [Deltaproteobacteria bacterium]